MIAVQVARLLWPQPVPDVLGLAAAISTVGLLALAGSRIAALLLPRESWATRAVAAFVVVVFLTTTPLTLLGHFGVLTPLLFLCWPPVAYLLSRALPEPAVRRAARPRRDGIPSLERLVLSTATGIMAVLVLARLYMARFAPPGAFAYDDVYYHLSAVATWRLFGDLSMIKFGCGDAASAFYPFAGELWSLALLAPVDPSDFLARWSELPFALLAPVAAAAIAGALGISIDGAIVAGLFYLAVPRVFGGGQMMLTAGNDNLVAFLTAASVLAALLLFRRGSPGTAVFTGLSVGLLCGTKYIGLLYAIPLSGLVGLSLVLSRRAGGFPRRLRLLGLLGGVVFLAGGYPYLRNTITMGNPIFPVSVALFGKSIFRGWPWVSVASRDAAFHMWRFLWERVDYFGPLFRIVLLPAAVLAPVGGLLFRGRSRRRRLFETAIFLLPAVFYAEFVLLMGDHRDIRYFVGAVLLVGVGAIWLVSRLPRQTATFFFGVLAATAAAGTTVELPYGRMAITFVAGAGVGMASWLAQKGREPIPAVLRVAPRLTGVAVVLAVVAASSMLSGYRERRGIGEPVARKLAAMTREHPSSIAVVGMNQPYSYFGPALQNLALYVPTHSDLKASYYEWGGTDILPRNHVHEGEWRRNLRSLGIGYIVVERTGDPFPELAWIEADPDEFPLLLRDGPTDLYRVNPRRRLRRATSFALEAGAPTATGYFREGWARESIGGVAVLVAQLPSASFALPPFEPYIRQLRFSLLPTPLAGRRIQVRANDVDVKEFFSPSIPTDLAIDIQAVPQSRKANVIEFRAVAPEKDVAQWCVGSVKGNVSCPVVVASAGFHAGRYARFRVGGEVVERRERGYILARLTPVGDRVAEWQVFDTGPSPAAARASARLANWVAALTGGTVVLGAVADEGSSGLTQEAVDALRTLGCRVDLRGWFRTSHAFIGAKGSAPGSIPEWSDVGLATVMSGSEMLQVRRVTALFGSGQEQPRGAAKRRDDSIPAGINNLPDGGKGRSPLVIAGWCQERGGGPVAPTSFRIDGVLVTPLELSRVPRPDVAAAIPEIGDVSRAGFIATFPPGVPGPGKHVLVVTFETPDGRRRDYPAFEFEMAP
ncbi:MAG: interleukin-like EMT inducer domain-containing protein [Acidithiobacillales bacterium]